MQQTRSQNGMHWRVLHFGAQFERTIPICVQWCWSSMCFQWCWRNAWTVRKTDWYARNCCAHGLASCHKRTAKPVNIYTIYVYIFAVSAMLHNVGLLFVFPIFSWFLQLDCLSQQNCFHRFLYFELRRDISFFYVLVSLFVRVCVINFSENWPLARLHSFCCPFIDSAERFFFIWKYRTKCTWFGWHSAQHSKNKNEYARTKWTIQRKTRRNGIYCGVCGCFVWKMHSSPQRVKSMIDCIIGRILLIGHVNRCTRWSVWQCKTPNWICILCTAKALID